jgi:REP element-mobilizing transposase RayT
MTNHVHLLVTPETALAVPALMQALGRRHVRHINRTYRRTGTLWEGRYCATAIDSALSIGRIEPVSRAANNLRAVNVKRISKGIATNLRT